MAWRGLLLRLSRRFLTTVYFKDPIILLASFFLTNGFTIPTYLRKLKKKLSNFIGKTVQLDYDVSHLKLLLANVWFYGA